MQNSEMSLFGEYEQTEFSDERNPALAQWYTPAWVAHFLVERYFSTLTPKDLVIEPSCGLGAFMNAIPEDVPAVGVEIDPRSAEIARENTGRTVITGDFAQVKLPDHVTAIIGNPPFSISIVESFLNRAYKVLPKEGRIGLLLPTYHFQTFGRVDRWMQNWGLHVDMIPRGIFPGIRLPLAYCLFAKDARHEPHGLALYAEAAAIAKLTKDAQELLTNGRKKTSVWKALVTETLQQLGGRATLDQMYRHIEPKRPTATAFWREKVRQQLQRYFVRCGPGEWAFDAQLAAA